MSESAEGNSRETPTESDSGAADSEAGSGVSARVEPDAAVVSLHAQVPPDAPEEMPAALRPRSAIQAVGARLRDLIARSGRRRRSDRSN